MVSGADGIRTRVLVAVALVVGGASWVVLKLVAGGGRDLPSTSWLAVFIFVALGLGLLVAGRPVKRLVAGRATRPLNPLYAARVLAMAQAAALAGAAIVGWYVAQVVLLLPDADVPSAAAADARPRDPGSGRRGPGGHRVAGPEVVSVGRAPDGPVR